MVGNRPPAQRLPRQQPLVRYHAAPGFRDSQAKRLFSSSRFARIPSGIGLDVKVVNAENIRL